MTELSLRRDTVYYKIYRMNHFPLWERICFTSYSFQAKSYDSTVYNLKAAFQQGIQNKEVEDFHSLNAYKVLQKFIASNFWQQYEVKAVMFTRTKYRKTFVLRTELISSSAFKFFCIMYNLRNYYVRKSVQKNLLIGKVGNCGLNFLDISALISTSYFDLYDFTLALNIVFRVYKDDKNLSSLWYSFLRV